MKWKIRQALLVTGAILAFAGLTPTASLAAPSDYKIEVVEQPVKAGKSAPFSVRITTVKDGKAIPGSKIQDAKLHMVMGKMDMPAPVKLLEQDDNGLYRFNGDLTMYGEWNLDVSVIPPGEPVPVQASLKFQVAK